MSDDKMGIMEKAVIGGVIGLIMIVAMSQACQAFQPAPPEYCCPICGEYFYTYDELYQHFVESHPAEDIEIIWMD